MLLSEGGGVCSAWVLPHQEPEVRGQLTWSSGEELCMCFPPESVAGDVAIYFSKRSTPVWSERSVLKISPSFIMC